MRTRITATLAAMLLAIGLLAAPATASDHGGHEVPPHGHMLLLHATWDVVETPAGPRFFPTSYARCVDLAAGRNIAAHHDTVHTGRAGQALRGAGHLVIPNSQLSPMAPADCAGLAELLPPRGKAR